MTYFYDDYTLELSKKFSKRLDDIKANFNFDLGDEFEIAICEVLREFLPYKYGVCRGFVVNKEGRKEGDDIIIYDQINFPTLRLTKKDDYSRKEDIPIEAVYAYIEAKHTLTPEVLQKSITQINKVKELCSQRQKVDLYQIDSQVGQYIDRGNVVESLPRFRNPIISIVLSRYASDINSNKTSDKNQIKAMLQTEIQRFPNNKFDPELIIAGKDNLLSIGYKKNEESIPTLFYPDNGNWVGYQNIIKQDLSYGILLSHLMAGLTWIRLGDMPWIEMLNQAKCENN
jgi:hypothetical protein